MLGPFSLLDGRSGEPGVPRPLLRKAQDLLALILLSPHGVILRETAAEALWPESSVEASKKSMRQALWQIHQATDEPAVLPMPTLGRPSGGLRVSSVPVRQRSGHDGQEGADAGRLVLCEGEALRVNPVRPLQVDVTEVTEAARRAQLLGAGTPDEATLSELERAADLYRGPLLAGCYDEWCLAPRARLEDRALTLLDTLSRGHEGRGDLAAAIVWAQRLLDVEPAHERTHRRLMRLYYRTGDRTRALRQLHRCRWVLQHELGVRPSAQTEELGAAIGADRLAGSVLPDTGSVPVVVVDRDQAAHPEDGGVADAFRAELVALRLSVEAIGERLRQRGETSPADAPMSGPRLPG